MRTDRCMGFHLDHPRYAGNTPSVDASDLLARDHPRYAGNTVGAVTVTDSNKDHPRYAGNT